LLINSFTKFPSAQSTQWKKVEEVELNNLH
jgi:hypothetical protein